MGDVWNSSPESSNGQNPNGQDRDGQNRHGRARDSQVGHSQAGGGQGSDGLVGESQEKRSGPWEREGPGVLELPSGRRVRGRALRKPLPAGPPPTCTFCMVGKQPAGARWQIVWLPWRDFRLPADYARAAATFVEAWMRAGDEQERIEIACTGGRGRTGTALACLAVLDGVPPKEAVRYVRQHYDHRAVETPWQKWFVRRFRLDEDLQRAVEFNRQTYRSYRDGDGDGDEQQ